MSSNLETTEKQVEIINALRNFPKGITPKKLSKKMSITQYNLIREIDSLEKGLIFLEGSKLFLTTKFKEELEKEIVT